MQRTGARCEQGRSEGRVYQLQGTGARCEQVRCEGRVYELQKGMRREVPGWSSADRVQEGNLSGAASRFPLPASRFPLPASRFPLMRVSLREPVNGLTHFAGA